MNKEKALYELDRINRTISQMIKFEKLDLEPAMNHYIDQQYKMFKGLLEDIYKQKNGENK